MRLHRSPSVTVHRLWASSRQVQPRYPIYTTKQQPILILALKKSKQPAWVTAIRLQTGALDSSAAIQDESFAPDRLLIKTFPSIAKEVSDTIHSDVESEAIKDSTELLLQPLV